MLGGALWVVLAVTAAQVKPTSIAVLPLTPLNETPADVATLLTEEVVAQFRDRRSIPTVLSPREVTQVMTPAQQAELSRCAQDNCAMVDMELAGALGVTHLFAGSVGRLGATYLLHFKILELRTARVVANQARQVTGNGPELLLPLVRPAVDALLDELGLVSPPPPGKAPVTEPATSSGSGSMVPKLAAALLVAAGAAAVPVALLLGVSGVALSVAAFFNPAIPRLLPIADRNARLALAFAGPVATGAVAALLLVVLGAAAAGTGAGVLAWSLTRD